LFGLTITDTFLCLTGLGPDLQKILRENPKFILSYKVKVFIDFYIKFTKAVL